MPSFSSIAGKSIPKHLRTALSGSQALVVTLTEDEQSTLRQIFREDDISVRLREKAMLQLGLYMGIRQSDIAGLTIDDIDWDNASIRIAQTKTDYEVILPMPTCCFNTHNAATSWYLNSLSICRRT